MMTKHRIFDSLLKAVAVLALAALSLYGWAVFFELPYLHYQNLPFPAPALVRAGEAAPLTVERCNHSSVTLSYTVTHSLRREDTGEMTLLPDTVTPLTPGCNRSTSLINIVPLKTAPGIYTVRGYGVLAGRFKTHRVEWYSEPFEVIAPHIADSISIPILEP